MTNTLKKVLCVGIIFYSDTDQILLEDRRNINKHGERWSFFGGVIEEGESKEGALIREVKEELGYDLTQYELFDMYQFTPIENPDLHLEYSMYLAKLPKLSILKVHPKAKMKLFTVDQALKLKITDVDKKIINDFNSWLKKTV